MLATTHPSSGHAFADDGSVSFQSRGVGQTVAQCPRPPHLRHLLRFEFEFAFTAPSSIGPDASEVDELEGLWVWVGWWYRRLCLPS